MALDKERLLNLAYQLLGEPGWPQGSEKMGNTALGTVAGIFREFAHLPAGTGRLHQALSLIEELPKSPLARYSMREQYQRILGVLHIRNGRTNHPALKNLSFEELAYVIGWVNRLHRAVAIRAAVPAEKGEARSGQREDGPSRRQERPEAGHSGKH